VTSPLQPQSGEQRRHAMSHSGFVLIVPLLVWNAVTWPQLPATPAGVSRCRCCWRSPSTACG
jgi:hypothetical protein